MNELGILKVVDDEEETEFYHIHTMKLNRQQKWKLDEVINTDSFLRSPSYNLWKKIREFFFEKVRSEHYEHLPSRKNCLFLSTSLESAKIWYNILGGNKQLVKIKFITGKYVLLDEEIYENEELTNETMNNDAHDYWSGDEYMRSKKISVLFDGIFKIEKEFVSVV